MQQTRSNEKNPGLSPPLYKKILLGKFRLIQVKQINRQIKETPVILGNRQGLKS